MENQYFRLLKNDTYNLPDGKKACLQAKQSIPVIYHDVNSGDIGGYVEFLDNGAINFFVESQNRG